MSSPAYGRLSWLGIGAQRSGSTWLAGLLTQHPRMTLGKSGLKELHFLNNGLLPPSVYTPRNRIRGVASRAKARITGRRAGDALSSELYAEEFARTDVLQGEWTPAYLPSIWAPEQARRWLADEAPVLVVLRDPVERFASAMRLEAGKSTQPSSVLANEYLGTYALWCGMYVEQLEAWANVVGRDRLLVGQYEALRQDPLPWMREVWDHLGLEPTTLTGVETPSVTSSSVEWEFPPGVEDQLRRVYSSQRPALQDRWNIDTDLWKA